MSGPVLGSSRRMTDGNEVHSMQVVNLSKSVVRSHGVVSVENYR